MPQIKIREIALLSVHISESSVSAGRSEGDCAVFCGSETQVLSGCRSEPLQWNVGRCVRGSAPSAAISSSFGLTWTPLPLNHQYSGFNHLLLLSTVLLPVIHRENTPSILDVDFFHHLVRLAQGGLEFYSVTFVACTSLIKMASGFGWRVPVYAFRWGWCCPCRLCTRRRLWTCSHLLSAPPTVICTSYIWSPWRTCSRSSCPLQVETKMRCSTLPEIKCADSRTILGDISAQISRLLRVEKRRWRREQQQSCAVRCHSTLGGTASFQIDNCQVMYTLGATALPKLDQLWKDANDSTPVWIESAWFTFTLMDSFIETWFYV